MWTAYNWLVDQFEAGGAVPESFSTDRAVVLPGPSSPSAFVNFLNMITVENLSSLLAFILGD